MAEARLAPIGGFYWFLARVGKRQRLCKSYIRIELSFSFTAKVKSPDVTAARMVSHAKVNSK